MQATGYKRSGSIASVGAIIQWTIATDMDVVQVRSLLAAVAEPSHARLFFVQIAMSRA
ncbi:hypothetical protein JAK51_20760 [Stenotrophomonas maltophilia]|uniref:hypothetical protein n=1 Tax=Stenotrophomonas maltophilia TaxID=40324 RepID=UPI0021C5E5F8|nr:hypothetical protein [Stenotrophomonas maltophilia]MCU1128644.1 hypothetical protein [Stenotrophomonas maltophilia]